MVPALPVIAAAAATAVLAPAAAALAPSRLYETPLGTAFTALAPFSRIAPYGGVLASGFLAGAGARRGSMLVAAASTITASVGRYYRAPQPNTAHEISTDPSAPARQPGQPGQPGQSGGAKVTVLLHNVLTTNRQGADGLTAEALNQSADLVALIEPTADAVGDELALLSAHFPFEHTQNTHSPEALALFSRHPILEVDAIEEGNPRLGFDALLDIEGTLVRVFVVHPKAPVNPSWTRQWLNDLRVLADRVAHRDTAPVLVVGDFNADPAHAPYREFLKSTVLHEHAGAGNTWPATSPVLPPFYAIDHILAGGPVEITYANWTARNGSDHYGIVATTFLHA